MSVLTIFVASKNLTLKRLKKLAASESYKIALCVCYVLIDDEYVLAGVVSRSGKAIF